MLIDECLMSTWCTNFRSNKDYVQRIDIRVHPGNIGPLVKWLWMEGRTDKYANRWANK